MRTGSETTGNIQQVSSGFLGLASGNTAQRPSTLTNGMLRYNTSYGTLEFYSNSWANVGVISNVAASTISGTEGITVSTSNGFVNIGHSISNLSSQSSVSSTDYLSLYNGTNNYKANVSTFSTNILSQVANSYLPLAGGTLTGPLYLPLGSASVPSLAFGSGGGGIYAPIGGTILVLSAGTSAANIQMNNQVAGYASVYINSNDAVGLPVGASSTRPYYTQPGMVRFNSDLSYLETYTNTGNGGWFPQITTPINPGIQSSIYYGSAFDGSSFSTTMVSNNIVYAIPFYYPNATTWTRIGFTTTSAANGTAIMGIYSNNGGIPGSLLLNAGSVSTSTAADKEITISFTNPSDWIWLAIIFSASGTGVNSTLYSSGQGWLGRANSTSSPITRYQAVQSSFPSSLPSTIASIVSPAATQYCPYLWLRKV
jgi:hypothetical protein